MPAEITRNGLLAQVAADPCGRVAPGRYDTARLVALAPWLAGHRARVGFLLREQDRAGRWGGPDGYALVPTLSATAALLTELRRLEPEVAPERLRAAVARGWRALQHWLGPDARCEAGPGRLIAGSAGATPAGGRVVVPDTIGVELIVPALVEELATLTGESGRLRLPDGFDARVLVQARKRFADRALSAKSWACLEVFGPGAAGARSVHPAPAGSVGCSAAATAAWLGGPDGHPDAVRFLTALQARGGGPVPGVAPITYFEAAWVLNTLAAAGLAGPAPLALLDRLDAGLASDGLGGNGAPAAPGLPADADDTAAVLAALLRHGRIRRPDRLLQYRATGGYFTCFPDERTPSVSTNAHVLEELALYLAHRPSGRPRFAGPAATAARWLLAQQRPDLLKEFPPYDDLLDPVGRVLLPRADIATETLAAGLVDGGWEVDDVTAYRTVRASPPPAEIRDAIKSGGFDAVLFTSSSTVRNLVGIAGKPHARTVVAAIGPKTAETATEFGLRVDVLPAHATVADQVEALAEYAVELRDKLAAMPAKQRRGSKTQGPTALRFR